LNLWKRALNLRGIVGIAWCAFLVWAAVITWLSSKSGDEIELAFRIPGGDKLIHFFAFAAGAIILCFASRLSTRLRWGLVIFLTIAAISAFGAVDEWHQLHTPGRQGGDVLDWLADTLGAIFGALSLRVFLYEQESEPRHTDR
jgi:VanZ family protein